MDVPPSLEEFLRSPVETIAAVMPATVIFASGGTRRSAALAGIELGDEFARWNRQRMLAVCQLFFQHGVQHLVLPMGSPKMFAEQGLYGQRLRQWLTWGLAGPESAAFYEQANWQVRLIVAGETIPELAEAAVTLIEKTGQASGPYLWYVIMPDFSQMWQWLAQAFINGARSRAEAVRLLYGEDIPLASLLISFGKPLISLDVLPPFLYEEIQCYWMQQPSYDLDETSLRTILYDCVYLRSTWRQDKTGRAEEVVAYRQAWEKGPIIGLGRRLGPFWYPAPWGMPFDTVE